eukprot:TRINITY_DN4297_c0_g1_i1.p1 TRINITY_DN4297_c0_g1~~TRINITY_DN4297_c0_g1_i1.p1  ORF type:complete len:1513 (-),score=323.57 TRINITY_DN4297_c0_g1_i1:311-4849(-)
MSRLFRGEASQPLNRDGASLQPVPVDAVSQAEQGFARQVSSRGLPPESLAGPLGIATFGWFTGIIDKAVERNNESSKLEPEDLYPLAERDLPEKHFDRLLENWTAETQRAGEPSLMRALRKTFFWEVFKTARIQLVSTSLQFVSPLLIRQILSFVDHPDSTIQLWKFDIPSGYVFAAGLVAASFTQGCLSAHYFQNGYRNGMHIRAALILLAFHKSLKMLPWPVPAPPPPELTAAQQRRCCKAKPPKKKTELGGMGQMTNIISADTDRFTFLMPYVNVMWSGTLQICIAFAMLFIYVGWAVFAGILVMFLFTVLSTVIQSKARKIQAQVMKARDERLKLEVEMLKIVKIIKLYAWEEAIEEKVKNLRDAELWLQLKFKLWNVFIFISFSLSPVLVSLATFTVYTSVLGHDLDAKTAFPALSLFNILRFPLALLPMVVGFYMQALVAKDRIEALLSAPEVPNRPCPSASSSNAVEIKAKSLLWPDKTTLLKDVDFVAKKGECVVVVGQTGSGKSGLLYALLGELPLQAGDRVHLGGSIGYCAQNAWIRNASLKDNITGGVDVGKNDEDAKNRGPSVEAARDRYKQVLAACALQADLDSFTGGDEIYIGDRGINLSGGQKQRVALARAVFADKDIYMLDDVLSALDASTTDKIRTNLFQGPLMKGKTVVLVTNARRAMTLADRVYQAVQWTIDWSDKWQADLQRGMEDRRSEAQKQEQVPIQKLLEDYTVKTKDGQIIDPFTSAPGKDSFPLRMFHKAVAYDVTLHASAGDKTGITFDRKEGEIVVTSVSEGLVKKWNDKPGNKNKVNVGDRIVEVNNSSEDAMLQLVNECDEAQTLNLRMQRPAVPYQVLRCFSSYEAFRESGVVDDLEGKGGAKDASAEASDDKTSNDGKDAKKDGKDAKKEQKTEKKKGSQQEQTRAGSVKAATYIAYAKACGGILPVGWFLVTLAVSEGSKNLSDAWLTKWTELGGKAEGAEIYGLIALASCFCSVVYVVTRVLLGQRGSRTLHEKCVNALLRAQMSFYDRTPNGQILNRLAEDTVILDTNLPQTMAANFVWFWKAAAIVVMCMLVTPYFILLMLPMFFMYSRIAKRYLPAVRDLRRLDAAARSPIFSHFSETMAGVTTIRAMQDQKRATECNLANLTSQMEAYFLNNTAARWLSLRLQIYGTILVFSVCVAGVYLSMHKVVGAGVLGLSITYAMNLTDTLAQVNRESADRETQMVSVERVDGYASTEIEKEAALASAETKQEAAQRILSKGEVNADKVMMRYKQDQDYILKGITLNIKAGERIGIVGRTGCGKSSFLTTLMRLVEIEDDPSKGSISIDGVDCRDVGLHTLRSKVAIIPQEPAILTGTVRFNLDPFRKESDSDLWDVLGKTKLKTRIEAAGGLDSKVEEGGGNYSVGELQLLCMARALLRKKTFPSGGGLLLLDEATSALDAETDKVIQEIITKDFECTTITIAHRIMTLMDYTKVAVFEEGKVREFDAPKQLLKQSGSVFKTLAEEEGVDVEAILKESK